MREGKNAYSGPNQKPKKMQAHGADVSGAARFASQAATLEADEEVLGFRAFRFGFVCLGLGVWDLRFAFGMWMFNIT